MAWAFWPASVGRFVRRAWTFHPPVVKLETVRSVSIGQKGQGMTDESESLYELLGGDDGVAAVVDEMYRRVLADPELAPFFAKADMRRLKKMQTAFIAAMVDGPNQYTGAELTQIHRQRGIERKHFSRFCNHMLEALTARGLAPNKVDQVLGRMAQYSDKITGAANVDG